MPDRLTPEEVESKLHELPAWSGDVSGLRRTVQAESFPAGIELVRRVAEVAEELDHHPDIDIRWRDVTFALATHSVGGVTELDFGLARRIDELAGPR
jgi:4a-hydroxytetrahydrobiopterin dehydratase